MMKSNSKKKPVGSKSVKELAEKLGINSASDVAIIEYKVALSEIARRAIVNSKLTVNEIVERSNVARSKVSAIKNGSLSGISCDLFLKVIAATGRRLVFKISN